MNIFWLSKKEIFPRSFSTFLLEHDLHLSGICTNPDMAVYEYLVSGADLVIMDFSWYSSAVSGVGLLNEFLTLKENMKVIITTSYFQETVHVRYRRLGACGYFTKNDSPEDIINCIRMSCLTSQLYMA